MAVEKTGLDGAAGQAALDRGVRPDRPSTPASSSARTSFPLWLAGIALSSLGVRLIYLFATGAGTSNDGTFYHFVANNIADGGGFSWAGHPTAIHPPAWPLLLAVGSRFGLRSLHEHQVVASIVGVVTVILVGLVTRRLAGARAGLIAAAIAGVYPGFWMYEHALAAETLALPLAALVLLLAYRLMENADLSRSLALGAGIGLLALVRSEEIVLVVVLALPVLLSARQCDLWRRISCVALVCIAVSLVTLPWAVYNLGRFDHPVVFSTQLGATLIESNCDRTYAGSERGYFDLRCYFADAFVHQHARVSDESSKDSALRNDAVRYMSRHVWQLPAVLLAREARVLGAYHLRQQIHLDGSRSGAWVLWSAFAGFWALVAWAAYGTVVLRRRRIRLLPLWAVIASVSATIALTFGSTRYRALADLAIVILAAVGVDALISRREESRRGSYGTTDEHCDARR